MSISIRRDSCIKSRLSSNPGSLVNQLTANPVTREGTVTQITKGKILRSGSGWRDDLT